MARTGRPRKITNHIARKIFLLAGYGLTTEQLADVFDFSIDAIKNLQKEAEFNATLKACKDKSDLAVVNSLYKRAVGYEFQEDAMTKFGQIKLTKVMHPDVTACIFWLKNRQRKDWREKVEDAPSGDTHYHLTFVSPPQILTEKIESNRVSELVL